MIVESLINYLIFILPCYVANASPVIFKNIIPMKTPIDRGKNFIDGKRILGDGKTIEGFIIGTLVGSFIGFILVLLKMHNYISVVLLSLGAMTGDCIGSFLKRRLGIPRGKPLPLVDQLTFVIIALLMCSTITYIPPLYYLYAILITPPLHLGSNYVAYLLKLKEVPW